MSSRSDAVQDELCYWKFINAHLLGSYSNFPHYEYLPSNSKPGPWLPQVFGEIQPCERGYHACRQDESSYYWLDANLYLVEYKTRPMICKDKVVGRQIRFVRKIAGWNARSQRLAAVMSARTVLDSATQRLPDNLYILLDQVKERVSINPTCDILDIHQKSLKILLEMQDTYSFEDMDIARSVMYACFHYPIQAARMTTPCGKLPFADFLSLIRESEPGGQSEQ